MVDNFKLKVHNHIKKNRRTIKIKCYESLEKVTWILDGSRFWFEGISLSVIGVIGSVVICPQVKMATRQIGHTKGH